MINRSKTYILPLINSVVNIEYIDKLVNSYTLLEDSDLEVIVLSYDKTIKEDFIYEDYLKSFEKSKLLEEVVDKDDTINIIIRIPERFINDYNNFLVGAYSKFNEKSKLTILNSLTDIFGAKSSIKSTVRDVLYLGEDLKKQREAELNMKIPEGWELGEIISSENETFRY